MRLEELDKKAEQDEDFKAYLKRRPRKVYQLLNGYVGACCMMLQRKVLLACEDEETE